jgi:hypothetical protein
MRFPQAVHRVGRLQRGILVDMDEGTLALACGIGDPSDTFLDQLAGGGAACIEIVGERG